MNARLALLGARRMVYAATVLAALAAATWTAIGAGTASDLVRHGSAHTGDLPLPGSSTTTTDATARAGAWIEAAWTAFLALVAPCIVLRAAALRTRGEVAWTSVSQSGVARSEASLAAGALAAVLAIVGAWSAFVAFGPSAPGDVPGFVGRTAGPLKPLVDHERPLTWRSALPAGTGLRARIDVSLVISAGGGGEVRLVARRAGADSRAQSVEGRALVLPRGGVEVAVPDGAGDVEFELSLPEPGARGYVASDDVTLWRDVPPHTARARIAARFALALAAWTLLAFGLGAWLAPILALGLMASAWTSIWWSDVASAAWTSWIPGANLARDLATAAEGRAPASVALAEIAAAFACALVGLALSRRGPERRP